jgi:uncharacterized membrane protein YwzB
MQYVGYAMLAVPFLAMISIILWALGSLAYEAFMKNPKENAIQAALTVGLFLWISIAALLIEIGKAQ